MIVPYIKTSGVPLQKRKCYASSGRSKTALLASNHGLTTATVYPPYIRGAALAFTDIWCLFACR